MLDIKALGGAGFASQRTTGEDRHWQLSSYQGVEIALDANQSDDRVYTLILKDHLLPPNPINGREQSTTSWEYDFRVSEGSQSAALAGAATITIFVPWSRFKATYRGKEQNDGSTLDLTDIKRFSIMIRRFVEAVAPRFIR